MDEEMSDLLSRNTWQLVVSPCDADLVACR